MAKGKIVYIASTNLEPIAQAITSMGQSASKKDKPDVLANKIKAISTDATGTEAEMLAGKTFYAGGQKRTGSMANKGAVNTALNAGGSYVIPAGYHNGSGKVTANSLASQTPATATASQILSGKTAYVNGNKITGTIPSKGAQTYTPKTTNQTIGAGQYLSGAQTILGDPNLVPANIVKGKTIFGVAGSFVMPQSPLYCLQSGVSSLGSYRQIGSVPYVQPVISSSFPDAIWLKTSETVAFVAFTNPIDVTLYKYITFVNDPNKVYNTNTLFGLISASALSGATTSNITNNVINSSSGWSAVTQGYTYSPQTSICNIENLTGQYYIAFGIPRTYNDWYIKDIYLSI